MARPILVACAQGPRTVLEVPFRSKLTAGCRAGSVPARQNRPLRPGGPQLDSYLITTLRPTCCGTRIYGYRCTQGLEGGSLRHLTERSKNKLAGLNAHAAYNWRCIAASSSRRYLLEELAAIHRQLYAACAFNPASLFFDRSVRCLRDPPSRPWVHL